MNKFYRICRNANKNSRAREDYKDLMFTECKQFDAGENGARRSVDVSGFDWFPAFSAKICFPAPEGKISPRCVFV